MDSHCSYSEGNVFPKEYPTKFTRVLTWIGLTGCTLFLIYSIILWIYASGASSWSPWLMNFTKHSIHLQPWHRMWMFIIVSVNILSLLMYFVDPDNETLVKYSIGSLVFDLQIAQTIDRFIFIKWGLPQCQQHPEEPRKGWVRTFRVVVMSSFCSLAYSSSAGTYFIPEFWFHSFLYLLIIYSVVIVSSLQLVRRHLWIKRNWTDSCREDLLGEESYSGAILMLNFTLFVVYFPLDLWWFCNMLNFHISASIRVSVYEYCVLIVNLRKALIWLFISAGFHYSDYIFFHRQGGKETESLD